MPQDRSTTHFVGVVVRRGAVEKGWVVQIRKDRVMYLNREI